MGVLITEENLEYKKNIESQIDSMIKGTNDSRKSAFTRIALQKLQDYGVIGEPTIYSINYQSKQGNVAVDAFYYDESDDSYSFFVVDYVEDQNDNHLTIDIINDCIQRVARFVKKSFYGTIQETGIDERMVRISQNIAADLRKEYTETDIQRIKYYVISNRFYKARSTPIIKDSTYLKQTLSYIIWGIDKFYTADASGKQREPISIHFDKGLQFIKAELDNVNKYESYLCIISGAQLAEIYKKYGSALLEQNVRSYLGANAKINKGMIGTIRNSPTEFFIYNNGIAVTGNKIQVQENNGIPQITDIEDMQIINGGQTTASIYTASIKYPGCLNGIYVQMKLTIIKDDSDYDDMVNSISRYSNSQSAVRPGDLFASHPFHVKFEQLSRTVIAPAKENAYSGTYWYYERSRGKYKQETFNLSDAKRNIFNSSYPKNQVIKKEELAKYYLTIFSTPNFVARGSAKCMAKFGEIADNLYKQDEGHTVINSTFFKRCVAYTILFRETDNLIYHASWYTVNGFKNILVPYTIAKIVSMIPEGMSLDYRRIWDEQKLYDSLIDTILDISLIAKQFFENVPNNGIVTEYAKKDEAWAAFKKIPFEFSDEFKDDLISVELLSSDLRSARKEDHIKSEINHMSIICEHSQAFWYNMISEARKLHFNSKQLDLLQTASYIKSSRPKLPSEKQFFAIWKVLEELKENGVNIEEEIENDSFDSDDEVALKITSSATREFDF